nr:hypothetical protein [Candidatus Sigynarchaeum springense]
MALKDRICTVLGNIKTSYNCSVPQPGYRGRACTAINATYTALGCGGGITPPILKGPGETCSLSSECQSNYCDPETLQCA